MTTPNNLFYESLHNLIKAAIEFVNDENARRTEDQNRKYGRRV